MALFGDANPDIFAGIQFAYAVVVRKGFERAILRRGLRVAFGDCGLLPIDSLDRPPRGSGTHGDVPPTERRWPPA